jgi:GWxTD domain-containing protein
MGICSFQPAEFCQQCRGITDAYSNRRKRTGPSGARMRQGLRDICGLILFCGWALPRIVPQERTAAVENKLQHAKQGTAQSGMTRPCFETQSRKTSEEREGKAVTELAEYYRAWLTEDVTYIITPEERCAYVKLETDEEREQFIEQFWNRRNSDPESDDNPFKEEHYRRILFANEKFGAEIPGWQTDRGRFYIQFGPPDVVESQSAGARITSQAGAVEDDTCSAIFPCEKWHYRFVEGLGENIDVQFVDPSGTGNYRLQASPEERDVLLRASPRDPVVFTVNEAISAAQKQIVMYIGPMRTPQVKFKDLEAMVVSRIIRDQVHFSHRMEYAKATHASTMTRIVINIPVEELTPTKEDDNSTAEFEIFGRIMKPSGRVVSTFERSGNADEQKLPDRPNPNREMTVALGPGAYRLALAVKDIVSGRVGVVYTSIEVPNYSEAHRRVGQLMN